MFHSLEGLRQGASTRRRRIATDDVCNVAMALGLVNSEAPSDRKLSATSSGPSGVLLEKMQLWALKDESEKPSPDEVEEVGGAGEEGEDPSPPPVPILPPLPAGPHPDPVPEPNNTCRTPLPPCALPSDGADAFSSSPPTPPSPSFPFSQCPPLMQAPQEGGEEGVEEEQEEESEEEEVGQRRPSEPIRGSGLSISDLLRMPSAPCHAKAGGSEDVFAPSPKHQILQRLRSTRQLCFRTSAWVAVAANSDRPSRNSASGGAMPLEIWDVLQSPCPPPPPPLPPPPRPPPHRRLVRPPPSAAPMTPPHLERPPPNRHIGPSAKKGQSCGSSRGRRCVPPRRKVLQPMRGNVPPAGLPPCRILPLAVVNSEGREAVGLKRPAAPPPSGHPFSYWRRREERKHRRCGLAGLEAPFSPSGVCGFGGSPRGLEC